MTDNRTTELLQKIQNLLDERGAEYTVQGAYPGWLLTVEHPTEMWTYKICVNTTGLIGIWSSHITPEQAIAATLGSGALTAEQVREAIEKRFDFDVWVPAARWQAIADELNGKLKSATCDDLGGIDANGEKVFHCSKCGCILSLYDSEGVNTLCTSFIFDYPRFCPECGSRIRKAVE